MHPEVSVVVAAYNEEIHLEEALRSIATQEGVSTEIVFVDDGSTDATYRIAERLAVEFVQIRVLKNPSKGKVSAFNYGVTQALGTWTCIFAGDDIMPPGSLAVRWEAVRNIGGNRPVVGLCRLVTLSEDKSQDGKVVPRDPTKGAFSGVSYLMDRQAAGKMWPVPEKLPNEDTWLELAALHFDLELVHNGIIGCAWRIHAGNSINLLVPWPDFNGKLTPRMAAASLFLEKFGSEVSPQARQALKERVACEEARKRGDVFGIVRTKVSPVAKLRAISLSNAAFYAVRRRAYALLSGW